MKIALALSVALNLLVAGVLAGAALRGGPPRELGFGPFAAALTEDDRAALKREFRARMPDLREMRRGQRAAMAGVLAALRADPFDPAALAAAMDGAAARMGDRLQIGQDLLIGHLSAMPPPTAPPLPTACRPPPPAPAAATDRMRSRERRRAQPRITRFVAGGGAAAGGVCAAGAATRRVRHECAPYPRFENTR